MLIFFLKKEQLILNIIYLLTELLKARKKWKENLEQIKPQHQNKLKKISTFATTPNFFNHFLHQYANT